MGQLGLEKIIHFYGRHKRMPSVREVAEIMGYKSKNAAHKLIQKLLDQGLAEKDDAGRLVAGPEFFGVKVLGLVEAGFPSPAEEALADTLTLDEWLIGNRSSTYMLKVKGESMLYAGIHDGDLVIVERTDKYKIGDIVIAEIDGEWTMKYLRKNKDGYYLEAANPDYDNLYPEAGLNIAAVVRGVVRKY